MKGKKKTKLEKRLMAYTAAAVGVLAMAPAAEAVVQYSGAKNFIVNPKHPVTIDLNGDGVKDFSFIALHLSGAYAYSSFALSFGYSGVGIMPITTSKGYGGTGIIDAQYSFPASAFFPFFDEAEGKTVFLPARLGTGYDIENTLQNDRWSSSNSINKSSYFAPFLDFAFHYWSESAEGGTSYASSFGNFKDKQTGCIGVRFKTDKGKQLYGWIRFQDTSAYSGVIKDWAYEDSGGPIQACGVAEQKPAVPVPTLNQWGIMALIALLAGLSLKAIKEDKSKGDA